MFPRAMLSSQISSFFFLAPLNICTLRGPQEEEEEEASKNVLFFTLKLRWQQQQHLKGDRRTDRAVAQAEKKEEDHKRMGDVAAKRADKD